MLLHILWLFFFFFTFYVHHWRSFSSHNHWWLSSYASLQTAVVQRVKGFAYYSLSFSRHNKNIKIEHFFLYILSRYFIWLHKWKGFNDICASLKHERMIDYSFQLRLILYPLRCRETISLRGPVFHRSHGHNLVRPGRQSEVIMVMYLRFAVNAHVHNQRHG